MIIKSLKLQEGIFSRCFVFSTTNNLIYSTNNSEGKTTLLRFLLYALGYPIPSTKGIDFANCETEIELVTDYGESIKIHRHNYDLEINLENKKIGTFVLPNDLNKVLMIIFKNKNVELIENLLGAMFIDQDKGWTLLNKGYVIGHYYFDIRGLVRGLSDINAQDLNWDIHKLKNNIQRYKKLYDVAKYHDEIQEKSGSINTTGYAEENMELNSLKVEKEQLTHDLKRVTKVIYDNKKFKEYVEDMSLTIKSPNGEEFPLKIGNIKWYDDSFEFMKNRKKDLVNRIKGINDKINSREENTQRSDNQLELMSVEDMITDFDKKLANLSISQETVKDQLVILNREKRKKENQLHNLTHHSEKANEIIIAMFNDYKKYIEALGISSEQNKDFIFTKDLKSLSGAQLHKIVFAFRLMYAKAIERDVGINLPIIIDSPRSSELDENNSELMMNLLTQEFSNHQIIVASIYKYDNLLSNIIAVSKPIINERN
ncbi:hypothetical protein CXB72_09210 [Lactobacillus acidophilus]|uniref:hypothetical protein n=1 Tax=Lactobacillus acidophilus TaxID=1579 RepID=UPI000F75C340|nr:hypothetical protein [Lactobacillus acidophilus]AZN77280.1 hypothetical protein CXB72_09210 [Lactobacillus acidophilus]